jgi:hypothetical protein
MRACIGRTTHLEPGFDVNCTTQRPDAGQAFVVPPTKVSLARCRLPSTQLFVLEGKKLVPVASRALDKQTVLPGRRGELVSKQELMARVWPRAFVEPANLMNHMSAPGDGCGRHRFVVNILGLAAT